MAAQLSCDVAIVGAGLAGLVAAVRASELGLTAIVLEKGDDELYLCNSRYTGGFFHVAMHDIRSDAARLLGVLRAATRDEGPNPQAEALAGNAGRALRWVQAQGVRVIKVGPEGYKSAVLAPPGLRRTGLHWRGRGGDATLRILAQRLAERGGRLVRGARAVRLVMDAGRCIGVDIEGAITGPLHARAVVVADGGFQADLDRLRREVSPDPGLLLQRGAATGTGDGARMAEAAGAKLVGLGAFYGHVQHRDALANPDLWPYPVLDRIAASGVLVDRSGQRFCDEGLGGVYQANAIARLADPASAAVIFDEAIWEGPGRDFLLPANPNLLKAGGRIIEAASLDELARLLDLDPAGLRQTVEVYNAACRRGDTMHLSPPRTVDAYAALPIAGARLMGVPVCAGITYTMGGIAIDGDARVLDRAGAPIAGLFAAGSTTGGLEGGAHAAYTGGLSKALVFGLLAAEAAAADTQTVRPPVGPPVTLPGARS